MNYRDYLTIDHKIEIRQERIDIWNQRKKESDKKDLHELADLIIQEIQEEIDGLKKLKYEINE